MPSWNDGETSSESWLGDFPEVDYCPDSTEDPFWNGIESESTELCRMHKAPLEKLVAFEGINTGRRFYACSVRTDVINCGFHSWVDPEWPRPMKNALTKLWNLYNESISVRITERVENGALVKHLNDEKSKLESKYTSLLDDVRKWMDVTQQRVLQQNYAKLKEDNDANKLELCESLKIQAQKDLEEMKNERDGLRIELFTLKEVQKKESEKWKKSQEEFFKEKEEIKEGKKKAEYMLYDLFKANDVNKDKLKRIYDICTE